MTQYAIPGLVWQSGSCGGRALQGSECDRWGYAAALYGKPQRLKLNRLAVAKLKCLTLNGSRVDLQTAIMWRRSGVPGRLERFRGRDVILEVVLWCCTVPEHCNSFSRSE